MSGREKSGHSIKSIFINKPNSNMNLCYRQVTAHPTLVHHKVINKNFSNIEINNNGC